MYEQRLYNPVSQDTLAGMVRLISILITIVIVAQTAIGGLHGTLVLCLGSHDAGVVGLDDAAESACDHDHGTPMPAPSDDYDGECCDDVQVTLAELLTLPRFGDASSDIPVPAAVDVWVVLAFDAGLSWRAPPDPSWVDPSREQHLAIVACTRLTL